MTTMRGNDAGASPLEVARREMRPHERLVWADQPVASLRGVPALGRGRFGRAAGQRRTSVSQHDERAKRKQPGKDQCYQSAAVHQTHPLT